MIPGVSGRETAVAGGPLVRVFRFPVARLVIGDAPEPVVPRDDVCRPVEADVAGMRPATRHHDAEPLMPPCLYDRIRWLIMSSKFRSRQRMSGRGRGVRRSCSNGRPRSGSNPM
jgi:hypothetical protein